MQPEELESYSPVMVMGYPRSGTTALLQGLLDLPGFCGRADREGHMLYWFLAGFHEVRQPRRPRFKSARAPWALCHDEDSWELIKASAATALNRFYFELAGKEGRWVDKTPNLESVRIAPTVAEIFPAARFIFAVRSPLDALYSFRKLCRREGLNFRLGRAADQWAELQREWRVKVRQELPPDSHFQVRQEVLALEPEKIARRLGGLLDLPPDQVERLGSFFATRKVYSMFGGKERSWSHADSWSAAERRLIADICGPEMRAWRYLDDDSESTLSPRGAVRRGLYATRRGLKRLKRSVLTGPRSAADGARPAPRPAVGERAGTRSVISLPRLRKAYDQVAELYPHVPSLSLWRSWELAAYRGFDLPEPILDLGCGDGAYFRLCWPGKRQVIGVDRDPAVARAALRSEAYGGICVGSAQQLPVLSGGFASVFSNCALEHMDDLDQVLANVHDCLRPGGVFLFSVITNNLERWLAAPWQAGNEAEEARAERQRRLFLDYHHHVNALSVEGWLETARGAGFEVESHVPIVPEQTARVFLQLDTLWHTPSAHGEAGAALGAHLQGLRDFPGAFGGIVTSLRRMESEGSGFGGVVVCARKPA